MGEIMMAMQVIGAIGQGVSQMQEGQAQEDAARVNAENMRRKGEMEQALASKRAERRKREGERLMARNRAALAAEGQDSSFGSALDFMAETEADLEFQALVEAENGVNANSRSKYAAAIERQRGTMAADSAKSGALFNTALSIGSAAAGYNNSVPTKKDPWKGLRTSGFG